MGIVEDAKENGKKGNSPLEKEDCESTTTKE